jgi:hypothetical protein
MFPIRNLKSKIEAAASGVDPASRASKARWDAGPSHRKSSRPPKNRTLLACFRGTRGATPSRGLSLPDRLPESARHQRNEAGCSVEHPASVSAEARGSFTFAETRRYADSVD